MYVGVDGNRGVSAVLLILSLYLSAPLTTLQVPIAQDEMALSLGYAASLEATAYGDSEAEGTTEGRGMRDSTELSQQLEASPLGQRDSQELDETTRSDISERPSVEDVESETGSTGALETRSLKDHKGKDELLGGLANMSL